MDPSADSEEKHEPVSDIDTALMDSLKVLDPEGLEKRSSPVRPVRSEKPTSDTKERRLDGLIAGTGSVR